MNNYKVIRIRLIKKLTDMERTPQHKCNCITDQKMLVALQDTTDVRISQRALKLYLESHDQLLAILAAAPDERQELIRHAQTRIENYRRAQ
jgi:uncharacterized protein (DUF1778 family)